MTASQQLASLGLELPPVSPPLAAYVPAVRFGSQIVTAGQLPMINGEVVTKGIVGRDLTTEQAAQAARLCTLNAIAAAASMCGGVDQISRILKLVVYVASTPDFTDQALVANGGSRLLQEVFGLSGHHARSAMGVAVLPWNAAVEVELTVRILD